MKDPFQCKQKRVFLWRNMMNKPTKKRRSFVTFAKDDDPIYKEGWTITTRAWGRLPKSDPQLAGPVRKANKNTGED